MKQVDDLMNSIEQSSILLSAPHDPALWEKAKAKGGHDLSAIQEEYNRLILEKYRPRSFWSRLFGR